jgi:hypothetical protein
VSGIRCQEEVESKSSLPELKSEPGFYEISGMIRNMKSSRNSQTHCLAEKCFSPDRFSPGLWQKALRKYSRGALKSEPGFYEISGIMRNMKKQRFSLGLWQKALRKYPGRALKSEPGFYEISGITRNMKSSRTSKTH